MYHQELPIATPPFDVSKKLRERLKQIAEIRAPEVVLDQPSADGTHKWLIQQIQATVSRRCLFRSRSRYFVRFFTDWLCTRLHILRHGAPRI